ncbi:hypothetical protein KACC15558_24700 [Brevibacterium ammoniilyticum]|uniref:DUF4229 domain-containing protein n=1 Tax=Brevibacterium ammoniilyticum TaxID=1046555 RepID=A0ABP9U2N9_9MICO
MRSFWIYTLARLGIIVAVGLILQPFLGFTLVMAVAAILIGALISYLLLGGMRAKVAGDIETRLANRANKRKRKGADESFEDTLVDENSAEQSTAEESAEAKDAVEPSAVEAKPAAETKDAADSADSSETADKPDAKS